MAFFEFPHTRTYDSDLAWLIKAYKILTGKVNNIEQTIEDTINEALQGEELKQLITQMFAKALPLNVKYPPAESGLTPALGDGETDDTTALQAMIAYANAHNMPMIFPAGVYRVTGLNVNVDTVFQGFDATLMLAPVSAKPLITLTANLATSGLTLNANLGGQTTAQNVINIVNGSFAITNTTIMGGKSCIEGTLVGDSMIGDSYLRNFQEYGIHAEGGGSFTASNVVVPSVASGGAMRFMRIACDNCTVSNFSSTASVTIGFEITGDNNTISANIPNAETPVEDTGSGNTWTIIGKNEKRYFEGSASLNVENYSENISGDYSGTYGEVNHTTENDYNISSKKISLNGTDVQLNPANPLTYKTPSPYNIFFKTIPFKDASGNTYDVLVKGEKTDDLGASFIFASTEEMESSDISFESGDIILCASNNGNNVPSYWKVVSAVSNDLMHKSLSNGMSAEFVIQDGAILNILALGISNNTSYVEEERVTTEIQWLLDNGYKKLFFPKGSYAMSIKVTESGTWILGEGQDSTIFEPDDAAVITVDSSGTYINWCLFSDFRIDGRGSDYVGIFVQSSGINTEWLDQSYFKNLYLSNGYNGMRWLCRGIWNVFDHVWFYGNTNEGLYVAPGAGCAFNHNSFNDCEFAGNLKSGFSIEATTGEQINTINFNHCALEGNWFNTVGLSSSADFNLLQCHGVMFLDCYIEAGKGAYNFNINQSDAIFSGGSSLVPNSPLLRVVNGGFCKIDMLHGYNTSEQQLCSSDTDLSSVCVVGGQSGLLGYQINEGVTVLWPTS